MKTIEETYQKLDQRDHILLRPGMYIGETTLTKESIYILNENKMEEKLIEYSPGFLKIFDEILSNAIDHSVRDPTANTIKVSISENEISVFNNGKGIPVVLHKEHDVYIPELVFGNLLAGSNYDDTQQRTVAGTNGLGATLANIFSKEFIIETIDAENQKKFIQTFTNNMSSKTPPKITKNSGKSYTKITFTPDYSKFGMKGLNAETMHLLKRRTFDCIATTDKRVKVYFNNIPFPCKGMSDYAKFFSDNAICETVDTWDISIIPSDTFKQISFVNGNLTSNGGKHVDYIVNQITSKLKTLIEKKKKITDLKTSVIKDRLFLILKSVVVNPHFNSQTKETLTTQPKDFGVSITVPDKFINKLFNSSITEDILSIFKQKELSSLSKTDGKKKSKISIPNLEDAIHAGTSKSDDCTLILTEGLSAMTFAMWGRSVHQDGMKKYGVYALKGKCVSWDTKIPMFDGDIKLAKDVIIGDYVIGDDGKKRKVLSFYKNEGEMFEIEQNRGQSYKVNDEHILSLCLPSHKAVYWCNSSNSWTCVYWDKEDNVIKRKQEIVGTPTKCNECGVVIGYKSLSRHYKRRHKDKDYAAYKIAESSDENKNAAFKRMQKFLTKVADNNFIDIPIREYLKLPKWGQRLMKGYRGLCVDWQRKDLLLDPYVLGLWLGDGCSRGYQYCCYAEKDPEILEYLKEWGKTNDAIFTKTGKFVYTISSTDNKGGKGFAPLKKILEKYNLIKNKHIPRDYLVNSKENRLKLLAGIVDTDGYIAEDGTIEIAQSVKLHTRLSDDIIYLARSLGYYVHVKIKNTNYKYVKKGEIAQAYIIKISGDIEEIPAMLGRKNPRNVEKYAVARTTGPINIRKIDNCEYIGIGIDGNNRFLINDFTVTHNCLNVRGASAAQIAGNVEINAIKQILGLKQNEIYKDTAGLRYSKLVILTDADVDGSHIKSLIMSFIHAFWPSLVRLNPSFIQTIKTPIVKATKGKETIEFFTEGDYRKWQQDTSGKGFSIKYFKGLGTSTKNDAKDIFKRIEELRVDYTYKGKECDKSILLAFDKDTKSVCSDARKEWLRNYNKDSYIQLTQKEVSYTDFIHKELIHFSIYDNIRSIPSICDGLKPSQRKILYYMIKKGIDKPIKVGQLSGYVSAETGYHHGETSLQQAIIGLAQDFIGTNNINLLYPDGNFGSRLAPNDAASPRYIFTRLEEITKKIFDKRDMGLLNYLEDDGLAIEPEWFIPIIPMILVNGCSGIGTGFSTSIPQYNPKDIITNLKRLLKKEPIVKMEPWFKNFKGKVSSLGNGNYQTEGTLVNGIITEIPVGTFLSPYKEYLESQPGVSSVKNLTLDENTDIKIHITHEPTANLKLTKKFSTTNMYLFNHLGVITKYDSPEEILKEFYKVRLRYYTLRREYLIKLFKTQLKFLMAKKRFVEEYTSGVLQINRKSVKEINEILSKREFPLKEASFGYLVDMPFSSITIEKIKELGKACETKQKELDFYTSNTPENLWLFDLETL